MMKTSLEEQLSKLEEQFNGAQTNQEGYFSDDEGTVQYNPKCEKCIKPCKQSYRATIKYCPRFKEA